MPNWKGYFAAKDAMPAPVKDTQGYGYQYATLAQVKSIVDPACAEHGIGYLQYQNDGVLHTEVIDAESGETMLADVRALGTGNDQQRGSSETYQRRYALLTVFGLAPEDDDGKAASEQTRATETAPKPKPAPKSKKALWAALGGDAALANAVLMEGHPDTEEFFAAVLEFWKVLEEYAAAHGGDVKALAEGCKKRGDAAPKAEFYTMLAEEFGSQI